MEKKEKKKKRTVDRLRNGNFLYTCLGTVDLKINTENRIHVVDLISPA